VPQTVIRGNQILDGSVQRQDLDVATPGSAVIRRIIAGDGVTLTSTGADAGTGDVTVNAKPVRHILFRVLDKATDWPNNGVVAVGGDLVIPFAGTITDIEADVDVAGVTGTATVDVNLNGTTIMTTNKLNWDSAEKSTRTFSGTAPGLTTTAVAAGNIITLDIDVNHTGTRAKGLTLYLAILPS
jgi:hypothetical protein